MYPSHDREKQRRKEGRKKDIPGEIIELIKRIANENPMWGIPRIHGEMLKLGCDL